MKNLIASLLVALLPSISLANNVTDTGPATVPGSVLYYSATNGNDQGTWAPVQQVIQQYVTNVPGSVGLQTNNDPQMTVGNIQLNGTGLSSSQSGNTGIVNFSGLQTNQSVQNASSITTLQGQVGQNTSDISTLNTNLNTTNANVSSLSSQVNTNTSNISTLQGQTATNTSNISTLQTGLSNETNRATSAENTLQNNINQETTRATTAENNLQTQTTQNTNSISNLNQQVTSLNQRQEALQGQINKLNETKVLLEPTIRLYDSKRFQVQAFDSYDTRHGRNASMGMRVMFKLGKSYEEKLIEKATDVKAREAMAVQLEQAKAMVDQMRRQIGDDKMFLAQQNRTMNELLTKVNELSRPKKVKKSRKSK